MIFSPRAVICALGALTGCMFVAPVAAAPINSSPEFRSAVDAAIKKVRPALVRIHVVSTEYREGREIKNQAVGSGAIISKDGFLVTNHHVAGRGERILCTLWDREEIEADLIGTDALTDISVLKLRPSKPREFVPAVFGDSEHLKVGDPVLAMGSPMALSQSVTLGILSNLEMMMPRFFGPGGRMRLDGEDVGSLVKWLGHDAAIYGGNSGGPLANLKGEIIGINELQFGLSGAIPGNLAQAVAKELIAHGKVRRSWIGIDVQPRFKEATNKVGVVVSGVVSDAPADEAGIQSGDLLLSLNGKETNVRYDEEMPEFVMLISSLPIGKEAKAVVRRSGKELKLKVTPVERGELYPRQREFKQWGMTGRNLSYLASREMKRTNALGVMVTSVRPSGPAGEAKPQLNPRDVLVEVNDEPIRSVEELTAFTERLTKDKDAPVPVIATFERESRRYLTVIKVGTQELRDPGLEVAKAWLPVETQVISRDIARQLGKPNLTGYYITQVYPHTTAEQAGLRPGDFILAVDNEKMRASGAEHEEELATLIRQYEIGTKVELAVLRGKTENKVSVELERSPRLRREMKKYRNDDFEFTVRDIAFFDTAEEQWKVDQNGVLVEEVKSGGWADLGSLSVEDLIIEVDGKPVQGVESLRKIMEQVARDQRGFVVLKVLRGIHTAFLELEPTWKK
jgi:serine protease Do